LLHKFVESLKVAYKYQFGFIKNHYTAVCTLIFKKYVSYYGQNGCRVLACFVDFSKAFNNTRLLSLTMVLLSFAYCYNHQQMSVCWHNISSAHFTISDRAVEALSFLIALMHALILLVVHWCTVNAHCRPIRGLWKLASFLLQPTHEIYDQAYCVNCYCMAVVIGLINALG